MIGFYFELFRLRDLILKEIKGLIHFNKKKWISQT